MVNVILTVRVLHSYQYLIFIDLSKLVASGSIIHIQVFYLVNSLFVSRLEYFSSEGLVGFNYKRHHPPLPSHTPTNSHIALKGKVLASEVL